MKSIATPNRPRRNRPTVVEQPPVTPPPKPAEKLTHGGQSAGQPGQIVSAANRWRENYNPLRNLTMRRVVELLELGQRGDYAWLQWAYRFIERRNPTLSGLLSRCEAPLADFDWGIRIRSTLPPGGSPAMAARQQESLVRAYARIDNLRPALLHLHLADFRGYAHLQKHRDDNGAVYHLEPLHQWCLCRDGLEGNWFWNPDSRSTSQPLQFLGLGYCLGGPNLPLSDFIIRECPRPVDELGLVDTVRRGLCEKDWDGFIEIYGIPGGVVIMPPDVPQGRESDYESAAKSIAEGAAGALPYGSDFKASSGPRGVDPFTPRLTHLDEALVLAGTGGKLAVLTEKSGDSRGTSRIHDKSFGEIAYGRARACANCFVEQFDAEILQREHPGEPPLAFFHFGDEEEEDLSSLCTNVLNLRKAGKEISAAWLSEKTGYPLTAAPAGPPDGNDLADSPLAAASQPRSPGASENPGRPNAGCSRHLPAGAINL